MKKSVLLQPGGEVVVLQCGGKGAVLQGGSKGAAGPAVALHCGGLRFATTALRCSGPGPSGKTRCVRCAHCAQTLAASQRLMRAGALALDLPLLGAAEAHHRRPGRASATPLVEREQIATRYRAKQPRAALPATSRGAVDLSRRAPQLLAERRAVLGGGAVCVGEKPSPDRVDPCGSTSAWRGPSRMQARRRRHAVGAQRALRHLTRCDCLSVAPKGRAASFATRPRAEHRSGVGAQRRPTQPAPPPGSARHDAPPSPSPLHSLPPNTAAASAVKYVIPTEAC